MTFINSTPFRWLAFIASAIIIYNALADIYDLAPRCNDGTRSSAIGTQGACSWHDGVDRTRNNWAIKLAALCGIALGFGPKWFMDFACRPSPEPLPNSIKQGFKEGSQHRKAEPAPKLQTDDELREIVKENEKRAALSKQYLDEQLSKVKGNQLSGSTPVRSRRKRR